MTRLIFQRQYNILIMSTGQSTIFVQTEIFQQLVDGLQCNFAQIFMFPRGLSLLTGDSLTFLCWAQSTTGPHCSLTLELDCRGAWISLSISIWNGTKHMHFWSQIDSPLSLCIQFNQIELWHAKMQNSPMSSQCERGHGTGRASLFLVLQLHCVILNTAEGCCLAALVQGMWLLVRLASTVSMLATQILLGENPVSV